MEFHKKDVEYLLTNLNTDDKVGLSSEEAEKRLEKYGFNELKEESKKSFFSKVLAQFNDFLIIILIAASIISYIVGEKTDSVVILSIVIINALLGLYQEGKAEKALEALKKMAAPNAKVIRDGATTIVPANALVPGDIVLLESGDIIPADLRLIESSNLKIEEASLTGESVPVEKNAQEVFNSEVSLGDRKNMAYMSTIVSYGRGKGVVVGTGHDTEIGKIATMIQTYEEEATPLQNRLNQLGKYLGIACITVCVLVFGIGLLQGRDLLEMFMIAISLAVAAIPEGLPAIVTIVLALGMNRMVKRNAIVKKLLAVETLGCTTVICSDKTGTLTQNEMTVVKVFTDNKIVDVSGIGYEPIGEFKIGDSILSLEESENLNTLLTIGLLCNDAVLDKTDEGYRILGDPTEGALVTLAGKGNMTKEELNKKYPRVDEIPFDSARKMMTTIHENFFPSKLVSFTKGAPDIVINRSNSIYINGKIVPLTEELKEDILNINTKFSRDALRVLALAFKVFDKLPEKVTSENVENQMVFVGLVGMIDPPRKEAKEAIQKCEEAGIKTVMITGDYKDTAFAIAKELGMASHEDEAIMGSDLDKVSDNEFRELVKKKRVYARVSPEHKVRIIDALKANGEIAAMTGDGVNDALALKKADIGVSMGITGTDVAKNTAEVILTDDNFASIVAAVEEGRIIYSNIKKFVFFLLSCNIGEILIVFLSILLGLEVPLIPIQLLWLNLVTDSFPALALGMEKGEPEIMKIPPRNVDEPILDKGMIRGIIVQSIAIALGALFAYRWGLITYGAESLIEARTITFATLITAELLRAYSARSEKHTVFEIGMFSNKTMTCATLISFVLLLVVIYLPFLQPIFDTYALSFKDWLIVISFSIFPFIVGELYKIILKKKA
ncbi:calcium-transporting P-type ATPase, PMR1-type [Tepidimicrobium xylanilyticum]|uniref:P-type Ca(2+) transporter n=1 Tax=Tepidimicrobium xylanilyticum TaxID=1123352 RepID=A0A1H3AL20_9FIRM|nr:calcium-transporting P-type ATPase, PMR1-type [Tepidimicrobium xylanilyticum]SDX30131.1 Ca2+-transporting ATPase [Tepidimicrobium xylanilyticum]